MIDEAKTKQQLIQELAETRRRFHEFRELEKDYQKVYEQLRASEEMHRSFLDSSPEPIVVYDKEGLAVYVNKAFTYTFGWLPEELIGKRIPYVPENCVARTNETLGRLFDGDSVPSFDTERLTKEGRILHVHISSALFKDKNGVPAGHIVTLRDITQRKKSRDALTLLATAVQQAAESIVITNVDGKIVYANPAFEKISGYSLEEVLGKKPSIVKSGLHGPELYEQMWQQITKGHVWTGRLINKRKDGTLYEEDGSVFPVWDSVGKIVNYVAVKRDVTQEVALEKQLRHAQKMEAVGTLAAGIAHDFNNILQGVLGYSEMILFRKDLADETKADAERIATQGKRGAELVRRLLTFSRKVDMNLRPTNLNHEMEQVKQMLDRMIPKMINIELYSTDRPDIVNADSAQIEQVLVNLAINARDSMPDGGTLILETHNVTLDEDYSRTHFNAKPGNYVQIAVSDTGHGMGKEVLDHIFEPFFTTKPVGEGSGLGLAVVYGIVKEHGGYIWCYSEPNKGTTFRVYLPAIDQAPQQAFPIVGAKPVSGSETILVVDDDEHVRHLAKRILTSQGYSVVTAKDSNEAIALYRKDHTKISLIILDLIMPGLSGKQCLAELVKIDQDAKVIIATGYSGNATKEVIELGAKGVLSKPFGARALCEMVRTVLDE